VKPSHYLHGTAPEEQARLGRLNDLINAAALREIALKKGDRVLDVGSGLGQMTRAMARGSGAGAFVVGVERSADQLELAATLAAEAGEEGLVEFRRGEATELPLSDDEWGTFDVAHARFLLEHLPNPLTAVRAMARAVRPGGRVILQDDPHDLLRLTPEPPGFGSLWQAYIRSFDRAGNDPYIGHRLVSLLWQAGCMPVRNTWCFFGSCAGEKDAFSAYVENLIGVLTGVKDFLAQQSLFDDEAFEAAIVAIRDWSRRPDAAIWYAIAWAEGRRPDAAQEIQP
jgi:SAM-dependent methyltransferase